MKKLYKSRTDVKIDGVCAGIANYFGLDPTLIRLVFCVFVLAGFSSVIVYILCAVIMPREPKNSIDEA